MLNSVDGLNYFSLGRDLTWNESLYAVNFDTKYQIYENLAAVVETGWAHVAACVAFHPTSFASVDSGLAPGRARVPRRSEKPFRLSGQGVSP